MAIQIMKNCMPRNIYYGANPDCSQCGYGFLEIHKNLDDEIIAVYRECLLGKLPNLELCNEYYKKEIKLTNPIII